MVQETRTELSVVPRQVLGKKVKQLRRQGLTPANIYGHHVESTAIQVSTGELRHVLRTAGRNDIVYLRLDSDESGRPTFIRAVQRDSLNDAILHVDFYQISLKEKVRLEVALQLVGVAPAVDTYGGTLLASLASIVVEGLPADIPSQIPVDVSGLEEIGQSIHVRDLSIPEKLVVLTDLDLVVASVAAPAVEPVEEVIEEVPEEAVPAEAEEAAAEAEGAAPEESGG